MSEQQIGEGVFFETRVVTGEGDPEADALRLEALTLRRASDYEHRGHRGIDIARLERVAQYYVHRDDRSVWLPSHGEPGKGQPRSEQHAFAVVVEDGKAVGILWLERARISFEQLVARDQALEQQRAEAEAEAERG